MNRAKSVNRLFLIMVLVSIVSPFIINSFLTDLTFYQSVSVSQFIFLVPVLLYVVFTRGEILNELQLELPGVSTLFLVAILAVLLLPVMSWLNLFSMLFAENYVASSMTEIQTASLGKNLMYVALVPALSEEFMFRGVFFHGYRPAGIRRAALFSGLCFGLIHMNLNQFFYAFVLGVVFCLLVEATGSLISSVLAHFIINANSVVLLALQQELSGIAGQEEIYEAAETISRQEILTTLGFYTFLALICGALAYGVLMLIARKCGRGEHMRQVLRRSGRRREETSDAGEWSSDVRDGRSGVDEWSLNAGERFGYEGSVRDYGSEGEREEFRGKGEERIVTPCLILAIAASLVYMIVIEFFVY